MNVIQSLQSVLVKTYASMALAHVAHWNVEGCEFFQLHAAFQSIYESLFEEVDTIAERIRALGAYAMPDLSKLAEEIKASSRTATSTEMAKVIYEANNDLIKTLQSAIDVATKGNDLDTQNMLLEIHTDHQKTAWMLKAFLRK